MPDGESAVNKAAIIIGGAQGIGAAIVRALAAGNIRVAWTHLDNDDDNAGSVVLTGEMDKMGVKRFHRAVDCTDASGTIEFMEEVVKHLGKPDYLVYSAGFTSPVPFLEIDVSGWRRTVDINLNGAFIALHAVIPHMLEQGHGAVVLIGSSAIMTGGGGRADYASAKAGLEGLSRAVTREFAPQGIRCNVVHPSLIETNLLRERHPDPARRQSLAAEVPLRRLGQPEDIANAVTFLLSEEASYITGQSLHIDGGRTFCK